MLDCLDYPGDDSPELRYALPDDKYDVPPEPPQHPVRFVPSPAGIRVRAQDRKRRENVCVMAGIAIGAGLMNAVHVVVYVSYGDFANSGLSFLVAAICVISGCLTWGMGEKKVPR